MTRLALAPVLALTIRPGRLPGRLLIAPQDIHVADPTVADDIYAGHFALAGRIVSSHGRPPFDIEPPSPGWAQALHGFGWLRHLRAADTALARANARALVDDWIASVRPRTHPDAFGPAVTARRLLAWLSHSPLLLQGADAVFYRRLMKSLMGQAAVLRRALAAGGLTGADRLWATLALAEISLCTDKSVAGRRSVEGFLAELDRQVLPDGGHASRNPQMLVDLLLYLLPLRQAFAARGAEVPPRLLNAVDRMFPMLRLFRHGDGTLALFNGMGVTRHEALATVLAHDDVRAEPLAHAPYAGYGRLQAGAGVVVVDTGGPPPRDFGERAHAGPLAFEFSAGGHALVVNCGHPGSGDVALFNAARTTAAHSTLVVSDTAVGRLVPLPGGPVVPAPGSWRVHASRPEEGQEGARLEAHHDGYAAPFGLLHRRSLALSPDGWSLRGEDRLEPAPGASASSPTPAVLRFHLPPAVRASFHPDGRSVLLAVPQGPVWRFEAGDREVGVEESISFGSAGGPRRSEQIVVTLGWPDAPEARWSLLPDDVSSSPVP